jgi:hypothetical protein
MIGAFELTRALGGRWYGSYGTARCIMHDDQDPSLSILEGRRRPIVTCHAGCDWRDISDELRRLGLFADEPRDARPRRSVRKGSAGDRERRQREKAVWLWSQRRPIQGTPAENYLRARGIYFSPAPQALGYLPPIKPEHHPAMIAAYGRIDAPTAVHLTLLRPDGTGKADVEKPKLTIASPQGMPIVVAPPDAERTIAICEGIEDSASVHIATGMGAWAAGSAGFMPKLANVVSYRHRIVICAHDDGGRRHALKLAAALHARGIETCVEGLRS